MDCQDDEKVIALLRMVCKQRCHNCANNIGTSYESVIALPRPDSKLLMVSFYCSENCKMVDMAHPDILCKVCQRVCRSRSSACGGCEKMHYCSKICQRSDWSLHQKVCKDLDAYVKLYTNELRVVIA